MTRTPAPDFVGMGKRPAQNLAEKRNLTFRLVSADGELMLGWPDDFQPDRVCCVVEDAKVVQAEIG